MNEQLTSAPHGIIIVNSFTVETGDLTLEGKLFALAYTSSKKKSVMGRLFG